MLWMVFFLAPLAIFTRSAEGFTLSKEALAGTGLAFLLASAPGGGWKHVLRERMLTLLLLFTAWTFTVSLFTAPVVAEVFRGCVHYALLAGTVAAVLLVSNTRPGLYGRVLRLSLLAGLLMAIYAILQGIGIDQALRWTTRFDGRVFSTLGNPNYLGGHLAALLPPAFLLALSATDRRRKLGWSLVTAVLFIALLMARTRGAYLAMGASFAVLGLLFLSPWGAPTARRERRLLLAGYGVAVLLACLMVMRLGGPSIFSPRGDTAQQRMATWKAAGVLFRDHPILGAGIDQLKVLYPAYQHRPFTPDQYKDHPYTTTEHVHNEFLRFLLDGGLVGLLLFLAVLASFGAGFVRRVRDPLLGERDRALLLGAAGGVTAVLVQSMSNFPLQIAPTTVLFALFLAAPIAVDRETPPFPGRRRVTILPFVAAGLVMLMALRALSISVAYRNLLGETELRNYKMAVDYGQRLLTRDPGNYKAWFAYGKALEGGMIHDTAYAAYQKTWEIDPWHVESMVSAAGLRLYQDRDIEAFTLIDKACAITPNYPLAQFMRGGLLFRMGRSADAAEAFGMAVKCSPGHFDSWLNLGVCRIKSGDPSGAVAAWREALQLKPSDGTVKSYLRANGALP